MATREQGGGRPEPYQADLQHGNRVGKPEWDGRPSPAPSTQPAPRPRGVLLAVLRKTEGAGGGLPLAKVTR